MIVKKESKGYVNMIEGVRRKTMAVGKKGMMVEFALATGAVLPAHSHPHEQIGYLISGEMLMTINSDEQKLLPGDSWAIPGDAIHSVRVIREAVVAEVFLPVREDYLD